MINAIIRWSLSNRFLVLVATLALVLGGLYSVKNTPVDAIPDLSDVQVIIKTSYPGQAPQVVEDQVTYPLTTAMLAVPGAETVRGYSFFGDSYVYIIFNDDTDMYWARSRVLEYLSQVAPKLPPNAKPTLGPDATGVGWVYSYVLQDKTGKHDLADLRSLQDWFLKYELQTVDGVSEVATVGGMVKQYQVQIDPAKLRAYNLTLQQVNMAIQNGNQETGASVIEVAEAEHMVPYTKWDDIVDPLKQGGGKWHPKTVPTLRGNKKGQSTGVRHRAAQFLDVYNTLAGQARRKVLGSSQAEFPNDDEAAHVFCLLMEHTHSKFRSSHRYPALLVVCAELRKTYKNLQDDVVKTKLAALENHFQGVVDSLT